MNYFVQAYEYLSFILSLHHLYSVFCEHIAYKVSVFNAKGPPVPIPNTEVKLCSADNTWLATARENRSTLTQKSARADTVGYFKAKGPPVPIPNTEVKLCSADNTWLATARKDKS